MADRPTDRRLVVGSAWIIPSRHCKRTHVSPAAASCARARVPFSVFFFFFSFSRVRPGRPRRRPTSSPPCRAMKRRVMGRGGVSVTSRRRTRCGAVVVASSAGRPVVRRRLVLHRSRSYSALAEFKVVFFSSTSCCRRPAPRERDARCALSQHPARNAHPWPRRETDVPRGCCYVAPVGWCATRSAARSDGRNRLARRRRPRPLLSRPVVVSAEVRSVSRAVPGRPAPYAGPVDIPAGRSVRRETGSVRLPRRLEFRLSFRTHRYI